MDVWKGSIYPRMHMRTNAMIDPQQLERRPNCVVGLSSQCCSRHAGKNGLLCAVLLLGSLAHLVLLLHKACGDQNILGLITHTLFRV